MSVLQLFNIESESDLDNKAVNNVCNPYLCAGFVSVMFVPLYFLLLTCKNNKCGRYLVGNSCMLGKIYTKYKSFALYDVHC